LNKSLLKKKSEADQNKIITPEYNPIKAIGFRQKYKKPIFILDQLIVISELVGK